jgi:hypothetical protein
MRASSTLRFWKVRDGRLIGRIESVSEVGLLWKHKEIDFRETSSNFANGQAFTLAIKDEDIEICSEAMANRSNVILDYNMHLIGAPWKGSTGLANENAAYVTKVGLYDKDDVKS